MERVPSHKRSKSQRIRSAFGSGGASKDNGSDIDSPTSAAGGDFLAPTSAYDTNRLTTTTSNVTMASTTSLPDTYNPQASAENQKGPATGLSSTPSIEDSVRTFKIYEALRSKDSAAISKAVEECSPTASNPQPIPGTTILHLAIQCAEPQIVDKLIDEAKRLDVNTQDRDGNTPLHLAAQLGRASIVNKLLEQTGINDAVSNRAGKTPLELARTPEIFGQLQLSRSLFMDSVVKQVQEAAARQNYKKIEDLLTDPRTEALLDVNALELVTEQATVASGGTLLHEAARKKDIQLAQLLLLHGADPFRRDRAGKLPQDVTKDEKTRAILKRSPAAAVAQRGVQEKAILGSAPGPGGHDKEQGKDSREMKGYLKKWTNYSSGYKLRWFVLEDGVLSYYKNQDDAGSACRGAINMRIAGLHMDPSDKSRFEIHGKSSVKYYLKANHVVEAKRWFWALNNAIQYTKDEAKEDKRQHDTDTESIRSKQATGATLSAPPASSKVSFRSRDAMDSTVVDNPSVSGNGLHRIVTNQAAATIDGEEDYDGDDASSEGHHRQNNEAKDAFAITAQSAKLQLDLLSRVSGALNSQQTLKPDTPLSNPDVVQAFNTYETAVSSLNSLVTDLLKIARDRDAHWQYRLERDADARRMWEESMAAIAYEHEDLKKTIAVSEDKRKRTKRALKDALEGQTNVPRDILEEAEPVASDQSVVFTGLRPEAQETARRRSSTFRQGTRRKSVIAQYTNVSDSESGDDDEFYDAIDAGEIEVVAAPLMSPPPIEVPREKEQDPIAETAEVDPRTRKQKAIEGSYKGYEDGARKKLKLDADNRPKISLWGILKSMIGKDMTKMTLPVSFNEPTSLLYRVAEDMEYADLLDIAADRPNSLERLVYVAAFAASEYASTIGRVAKPFNPLLGETYEYVRPDKGYRFFAEQVSHHPPIGAAYAESARWDYYGESAVRTKFLGKSFDANPLGTWFCRLRPQNGKEELYTWKKVTTTVIGIITGNPTIDNWGMMEIKNWSTGETCMLDFRARGWKASSAYHVVGKVMDRGGVTKWSIGGRWNDKIYARITEGFEDESVGEGKASKGGNQAIQLWQAGPRPSGIPFNLTPFAVSFNDDNPRLKAWLPPTDSRLRPDQRAMEEAEYDRAAEEKNRVEEKQRASRRARENAGEEWKAKWFSQKTHPVTGEPYWEFNGDYWKKRDVKDWSVVDEIF